MISDSQESLDYKMAQPEQFHRNYALNARGLLKVELRW
jgi:hypothetical protein